MFVYGGVCVHLLALAQPSKLLDALQRNGLPFLCAQVGFESKVITVSSIKRHDT